MFPTAFVENFGNLNLSDVRANDPLSCDSDVKPLLMQRNETTKPNGVYFACQIPSMYMDTRNFCSFPSTDKFEQFRYSIQAR